MEVSFSFVPPSPVNNPSLNDLLGNHSQTRNAPHALIEAQTDSGADGGRRYPAHLHIRLEDLLEIGQDGPARRARRPQGVAIR